LAAQAEHEVEPSAKVAVPAAHVEQLVAFAFAANELAAQSVHEAALEVDEKDPAGHTEQLDDVAFRNVPGAQEHVSELPEPDETKPGLQAQLLARLPSNEAELAGHFVHVVSTKK